MNIQSTYLICLSCGKSTDSLLVLKSGLKICSLCEVKTFIGE